VYLIRRHREALAAVAKKYAVAIDPGCVRCIGQQHGRSLTAADAPLAPLLRKMHVDIAQLFQTGNVVRGIVETQYDDRLAHSVFSHRGDEKEAAPDICPITRENYSIHGHFPLHPGLKAKL
jgi:hypothetical protein